MNYILRSVALLTLALIPTARAVTSLNDSFAIPSDWKYLKTWAAGEATFGPSGLTLRYLTDAAYQSHGVRYVGPGYYRTNAEAQHAFNWFGHQGPITFAVTVADFPPLSAKSGELGYGFTLALVCNDTTEYDDPIKKPATVLSLRVEDVGPRSSIKGQNMFIAQLFFKVDSPRTATPPTARLIRLANESPDVLSSPVGTWSFTIEGNTVYIVNPLGEHSPAVELPEALVLAHAADSANLYLVVGNNQQPGNRGITFSRITVTPTAR